MLKVNDQAPNFKLENQNGDLIELENYRGKKVVVYFYPKDNTPGCTSQACAFRDYNDEIEKLGAVILGISKDPIKSHDKFANKHELNFNILSDEDLEVIKAFGVWQEKKMFGKTSLGVVRSTFIINEEGIIEKVYPKAKAKTNAQDVYEYLKSLQED